MQFLFVIFRHCVAAILLVAGCAVLWKADSLMLWLIWEIGEEWALGPDSVAQLEGGGKLLTNPGAMMLWTVPFWVVGFAMVVAGLMLLWPRSRKTPG